MEITADNRTGFTDKMRIKYLMRDIIATLIIFFFLTVLKLHPPVLHEYPINNNSLIEHTHSFSASRRCFRNFFRGNSRTKQRSTGLWNMQRSYLFIAFWSLIVTLKPTWFFPWFPPIVQSEQVDSSWGKLEPVCRLQLTDSTENYVVYYGHRLRIFSFRFWLYPVGGYQTYIFSADFRTHVFICHASPSNKVHVFNFVFIYFI